MTPREAEITIAAADCETDPFEHGDMSIRPFIWGYFDGGNYYEFLSTLEFVKFCREKIDSETIIYLHNGGKFDLQFLFMENCILPTDEILMISGCAK